MVHNMLKCRVQICFGKPVYRTFRYFFHVEMRFDLKDPAQHCIRIYTCILAPRVSDGSRWGSGGPFCLCCAVSQCATCLTQQPEVVKKSFNSLPTG